MRSCLILVVLFAPRLGAAAAIQEVEAKLSSCQAAKVAAERHLANISRTPDKYKNVPETKRYLRSAAAQAEECIAENRPKMEAHLAEAAVEEAAAKTIGNGRAEESSKKWKPQKIRHAGPLPTAEPLRLRNAALGAGMALVGVSAYLGASVLFPPTFPLAAGAAWGMVGGTLLAAFSGFIADFNAFTDRSADEQRYRDGNRDDAFMRQQKPDAE